MSESTTILVTGATGTVGSHAVAALAQRPGISVRAAVHSPEKADRFSGLGGVTTVALDFGREDTIDAALDGVNKVFLVTPFDDEQVENGERFITAAKRVGLEHLVKLSTSGAEQEPGIQLGRWHARVEQLAGDSGIPTTILRPNAYMTNFIGYFPPDAQGNIYLPLGEGATSYVDPRDIADVAATVLSTDGHEGKAYTLTGPEALTMSQVAAHLSEASGRTIRYVDVPQDASRSAMEQMGAPGWMIDGMLELFGIMKAGYTAAISPHVREVTGNDPRGFAEFARDHADAWRA